MRGHIRKRGVGYQIVVDIGRDPLTGKRKQKSVGGFKTKKEAEKALAEMIAKVEKGEYFEETNMTLEEYLNKWLEYTKYNVSENTYIFYKEITTKRLIPMLGKIELKKLKAINIQTFLTEILNSENVSPTTVRHYYNVLNIALNQAVKMQLIQINPCNSVIPPKKKENKINVLTPEQVKILLDFTKESEFSVMYIPLHLALFCGLRRGEILGLQWNNVDFENNLIRISDNMVKVGTKAKMTTPKSDNSVRTVAILNETVNILKQHRKKQLENKLLFGSQYNDTNFVCTWPDGRHLKPDYLTHTLKKLLKKCNLPDIRFHDLRHTHATLLLMQGVNPKIVAERLGHSKVDITLDTYSHVLPEMQQEAVRKLDELFKKAK